MKSSTHHIGKFGNEASRRLYRVSVEIAQKLEQQLHPASSLADLFSIQITDLRMRLKDYCERLIFTDPVEYGKKAEDLLWRKVFYDFFFRCKQNRKQLLDSEYYRSTLISHLLSGIGSYHHILLRIQTEFHIDLQGKVDSPFLWHLKGVKKERWKRYQQSAASDSQVQTWANQACHRVLIYLGDLERYIAELDEFESNHLAERYYQQAFCINSQNGTPHNQLGSLYNNRFDSAYHYMRCLSCEEKFEGAEGNLKRVFEKNDELLQQLDSMDYCTNESLKCSRFLSRFLKLCQIFYFSSGENSEMYCQDILTEFDNCMLEENRLSDDILFKVIIMSMICMTNLHSKGNADVSTATAFSLALFCHVVHHTTKRLLASAYENKADDSNLKENSTRCEVNKNRLCNSTVEMEGNKDSVTKRTRKVSLKKFTVNHLCMLRRRRKMSSTSQEDSELSEGEMMELPESDEESILLNSDVSQTGSCSSESLSENEDEFMVEQKNIQNDQKNKKESVLDDHKESLGLDNENGKCLKAPCENNLLPPDKLIQALKSNGLLPCLKILTDWLRTHREILSACAESSQLLLSRLVELLNIILKIENKLLYYKDDFLLLRQSDKFWQQTSPLPEDTTLQNFAVLKDVHSHLSFSIASRRKLSTSSQVFLRIQCLLSFGRCLTYSCIGFDEEKNHYYFNLKTPDVVNSQDAGQQLMRSMAHLWLEAEVNDLESLVEGGSAFPPFLVADSSALCHSLSFLRQLVAAASFIVVVPLVVIANLDQLKKESIGAREAIRWLEFELRKGCRYIRAQRQMEKISLVPMKYPKKKEKEAWDFFQVLECCHYVVQQQSNETGPLVTLLVGSRHHLPDNATALAHSIDVSIENIGFFFSKWRSSTKNPG